MKFEIETYKGQLIEYDDSYDKFICDISVEDKFKTAKRLSLAEIRKEIDAFIKLNADFKPFKALQLDGYSKDYFSIVEVTGLRTDGKFVVGNIGSNSKSFYGKKSMDKLMVFDSEIVKESDKLQAEKDKAYDAYKKSMKELCTRLIKVDVSKYDHIINPSD